MARGRGRHKSARSYIWQAYRLLGMINTWSIWLTGDPKKIAKHYMRKRTVKFGGRIVK